MSEQRCSVAADVREMCQIKVTKRHHHTQRLIITTLASRLACSIDLGVGITDWGVEGE